MQTEVSVVFDQRPLASAVEELCYLTGLTIVLDPRTGKGDRPVTATFNNGVPVSTILEVLADMTDLKLVEMRGALYLTSAENAARIRRERKALYRDERWRKHNQIPDINLPLLKAGEAGV